jgi:hypothetical protein
MRHFEDSPGSGFNLEWLVFRNQFFNQRRVHWIQMLSLRLSASTLRLSKHTMARSQTKCAAGIFCRGSPGCGANIGTHAIRPFGCAQCRLCHHSQALVSFTCLAVSGEGRCALVPPLPRGKADSWLTKERGSRPDLHVPEFPYPCHPWFFFNPIYSCPDRSATPARNASDAGGALQAGSFVVSTNTKDARFTACTSKLLYQ